MTDSSRPVRPRSCARARENRWPRFTAPSDRAAAGVAVGAGDRGVPDDPPHPGRPGPGRARARPPPPELVAAQARVARPERPAAGSSTSTTCRGCSPATSARRSSRGLPVADIIASAPSRHRRASPSWPSSSPSSSRSRSASPSPSPRRRGRGRRLELGFASGSVFVSAIPDFLLGVALVYVFGVTLGWLPVAGRERSGVLHPARSSPSRSAPAAVLARIVRVEMLGVLEADFVRTARAKRLPRLADLLQPRPAERRDRDAHPRRAHALGSLVVGTVLVESVFAWPGLGSTIVVAIQIKDYPLAQATVLVYGAGVLIINTIVDCGPRRARPPHDRGGALMRAVRRILRDARSASTAVTLLAARRS